MTRHDWHWTFGHRSYIHFQGGAVPIDGGLGANTFIAEEGCATIADLATGALRCGTDSMRLFNDMQQPVGMGGALGGDHGSAHGAIIIPPVWGGSRFHIFAVDTYDPSTPRPVTHTAVTVSGSTVAVVSGPAALPATIGPSDTSERLAAISHADCDKFWVIAQGVLGGHGRLHAILVDSDAQPTTEIVSPYPFGTAVSENCCKFSPDGKLFAVTAPRSGGGTTIDIMAFSRATGQFTRHSEIVTFGNVRPYGVEFSPNSLYLYFTLQNGHVRRHAIGAPNTTTALSSTQIVSQWNLPAPPRIGALQLGPNGKIYGARMGTNSLFEIGDPDNSAPPTPASVQFDQDARTTGGLPLQTSGRVIMGLPTFPRIADDCRDDGAGEDLCAKLAAEVDELIASNELHNSMLTCRGEPPAEPHCEPVDIPPLEPQVYIRWGDSRCDCIEGDDTEIMHLTVC
ncbi:MAG TPA: hypothetical protein VF605_20445, partial [Allosphingosinicella sp.]